MAKESIHDERPLRETFNESQFLRDFREIAAANTRGCIIMERPDLLVQLAEKHGAHDSTARATVMAELESMTPRTSQYHPGDEIPERSLAYRLAKRIAFNDFGAYSRHFHVENWRDPREPQEPRESDLVQIGS
jgi:hypothetical protein